MDKDEQALVSEALLNYDLEDPEIEFIRHNENITCKLTCKSLKYILRIHKPMDGFSTRIFGEIDQERLLRGEMELLDFLSEKAAFTVQTPLLTKTGDTVCILTGSIPACILNYIEGSTLKSDESLNYAAELGEFAALIDTATQGFDGYRLEYSHKLVLNIKTELNTAFKKNHITKQQLDICERTLCVVDDIMTQLDEIPNAKGLIHADLGFSNILKTENGFVPIDFSLSGYGYKALECGMISTNFEDPILLENLRESYQQKSGITVLPFHRDAFFAFAVLLFIASQHDRFYTEDWFKKAMDRWCSTCFSKVIK